MKYRKGTLTLTIAIDFCGDDDSILASNGDCIAERTGHMIANYDDGRYPFPAEMITRGLSECLQYGVREAFAQYFESLHPGKVIHYVTSGGRGQYLLSDREASEAKFHISAMNDSAKVQINWEKPKC